MEQDISILKQLFKRPSTFVAASIILLTSLIALLAYVLAPDHTPYANRMVIELGAKQPGFQKKFLLVPKAAQPVERSAILKLLSGRESGFVEIPMNGYQFTNTGISISHYIDDGLEDNLQYSFAEILPQSELGKPANSAAQYIQNHNIIERKFYLGTDRYGRDILSRLIVGSRVSLAVGFIAVILSLTIGILLGATAGYFGGLIDNSVMFLINLLFAIPTLLLVFAITLTIGKGFWEIFVAIGLTMWIGAARLIRGQVLVLKEMEYVTAAKALGLSDIRIIFRHILPNIAGPLMVIAASNFATAILIEAGLSFLGIGVQPPQPSWGLMIKEHYNFLLTNRPMLAIIPGLAIMLLVYAFNVLGNALRDILDVRG